MKASVDSPNIHGTNPHALDFTFEDLPLEAGVCSHRPNVGSVQNASITARGRPIEGRNVCKATLHMTSAMDYIPATCPHSH